MKRTVVLLFSVVSYVLFLAVCVYAVAFIGNVGLTHSLDAAPLVSWPFALAIDAALVLMFGLQHSVMARPAFKQRLTRFIPQPAERSVYVLASNVALFAVLALWQPLGGVLWNVESPVGRGVVYALFALGWLTVVGSSWLINHFDLFGLRQAWLYYRDQPYTPLKYATPGPYRYIRHPLYVGWLLVFWSAPTMTVSHLVFALGLTAYILVAIRFEERDLIDFHGDDYREYRRRTPMFIPRFWNVSSAKPKPSPQPAGNAAARATS